MAESGVVAVVVKRLEFHAQDLSSISDEGDKHFPTPSLPRSCPVSGRRIPDRGPRPPVGKTAWLTRYTKYVASSGIKKMQGVI